MRRTLSAAAAVVFYGVLFTFDQMQQSGTQIVWSILCGTATYVFVLLVVAAARADS